MGKNQKLHLRLQKQRLTKGANGYTIWEKMIEQGVWEAEKSALMLCDVWDKHWSRGANERLATMLPRMSQTVKAAREKGVQIIHCPSETMDFYEGTPARRRMKEAPVIKPPAELEHENPPLPIDDSDGGSDTGEPTWHKAWSRQHSAIEIDQEKDGISDNGVEVYNFIRQKGINNVMIMGVHTNMCILHRSFAIKQMVRWGVNMALIRDLTDAMYNPAKSPYVSHAEGTALVIEYIEKFWCPTLLSDDIVKNEAPIVSG